jgi:hypothetical protein
VKKIGMDAANAQAIFQRGGNRDSEEGFGEQRSIAQVAKQPAQSIE